MKTHHKNSIKSAVGNLTMRPRVSRHGKLLADVYTTTVPAITERQTVLNKETGLYEVVHVTVTPERTRPMTPYEIEEARYNVLRARTSTTEGWRKNESQSKGKKVKVQS